MIYLLLSILFSSFVMQVFKWLEKYSVPLLPAIAVNYAVCAVCGLVLGGWPGSAASYGWLLPSVITGFFFISTFFVIGRTAQQMGVSVSIVAAKMSVVIPVLFCVFRYDEKLDWITVAGIALSLLAVWLVSGKAEGKLKVTNLWLPLLVFMGSGAVDTLMKLIQAEHLEGLSPHSSLAVIFATAAVTGLAVSFYKGMKPGLKVMVAGLCLGVPNYFSMFFLFKVLQDPAMPASTAFPVNNVSIVLLSTFAAWLLFKEKLSGKNLAGVLLAVISILLIASGYGD